jgi:hypothetical protein
VIIREESFAIEARFQLQSSETRSLTAQKSAYEMKVYANELASGESKLLTTCSESLVKDVPEYTAQTAVPGLSPGVYSLVTLVTLGAPNRLAGYHDGPVIQVI